MVRKKLMWYQGAVYHITTRGNHRNDIYRDGEDYLVYLTILKEALEKYNGILYCYCLMTNHVHLIIETGGFKVSEIMRRVNLFYTKYFNNKYNLIGHLFQGRYFAELIENDRYILEASRYVHLNPLRANMVAKPEEYEWSSYSMIIGLNKENLIDSKKILSYFKVENNRELYRKFVKIAIKINKDEEVV
ncbi:transposase [Clostridium sp. DJ247]|uniref:transposase n=1 Tax=Clostridium sp. DJ247 TaxID=2726188 RepID=UPI001624E9AF|nr:transposase [Clostridium sp. DJ247]MBC2581954.1 transposase [Clostridium sp. DJ247]